MPSSRARILCTEDDADTLELIRLVLVGEGYEVVTTDGARVEVRSVVAFS